MKTNKYLVPFIVVFLIIVSLLYVNKTDINTSERKMYEKFLLKEYKKIPKYPKTNIKDLPKQDRPDLAAIQNYFMTIDPKLKRVPFERLKASYKKTRNIIKKQKAKTESLAWTSIPSDMGGRTRTLMYDPNDITGNKVWAGGVTGGLWYNNDITDEHDSWIPIGDFWDNISISCITYDPNNTQIFYVGTGEPQTAITMYRESSSVGAGIWKTTDGGETWEILQSTEDFIYITDIVVRNESGNSVIYAGVVSGLYKGTVHQSSPTDGLYRSTNDGNSWEQVLPNINDEDVPYAPSDIEIAADGRIYLGTMRNLNNKGGATILYSDTGVSGSWTIYSDYNQQIENETEFNIPGRVILACAASDENIVYAVISVGSQGTGLAGFNEFIAKYIIKSSNKGATWTETANLPDHFGGRNWAYIAWHALAISVDPNNPSTLIVGGLDLHKSTNSGETWTKISDWAKMYYGGGTDYVHADHHAIVYKSGTSNEILFTTDGGIFYTNTGDYEQPEFIEKSQNYNTLQFYTCAISQDPSQNYYLGGLQDNGTIYAGTGAITIDDMVSGGDGAYCFFDKDNSNIFITSVYYNVYYIFLDGILYNYTNEYGSGLFINPATYDYRSNTIYANAVNYESDFPDQILKLSGIPNNLSGQFITLNTGTNVPFSHVKVSPYSDLSNPVLFVGTQSGSLFKVDFSYEPFELTEIGSIDFPNGNISCISIGGSEDTILVTFSNYGVTSIWQTTNGGSSWQNKEGNLPDMPVRWVIYHPNNSYQALIATEIGIWSTNNLNSDNVIWQPEIEGLANVRVDMLDIRNDDYKVVAATHGRGLFYTTFTPDEINVINFTASDISINTGDSINFTDNSTGSPISWEWTFEGGNPISSTLQNSGYITYDSAGTYDVSLSVTYSDTTLNLTKEDYINVLPTGIIDNIETPDFVIFPNPTKGALKISFNQYAENSEIIITNINGKIIKSFELYNDNISLDLSEHPKGVYFITFKNKNKIITKKFILL
ncbi:MAG: T9SS type A sorting domain-containing protein [Bacteroidales bacterium]|nr:T9SS type A sorting domain-containing protein [Bacteroidales bacterium]